MLFRSLTATRTALAPTGAPGAGGKRFLSDVTYAAEGGLMDIVSKQPNQNVTFMASGGIANIDEYLNDNIFFNPHAALKEHLNRRNAPFIIDGALTMNILRC